MRLSAVDCFSGCGGMALAVQNSGFELSLLCEIEPFLQRILAHHFPDVPICDDVHRLKAANLPAIMDRDLTIGPGDTGAIHLYDGYFYQGSPTLLTGGFPLQANFSRGERRDNDPRSLWDQFARVARELRPTWVVVETIPRFSQIGLDDALWDLEREGYATTAVVLPAQAFGALARKDRLYMVGAKTGDPRPLTGEPGRIEGPPLDQGTDPRPELHRVCEWPADRLDFVVAGLSVIGDSSVPRQAGAILRAIHDVESAWQEAEAAVHA